MHFSFQKPSKRVVLIASVVVAGILFFAAGALAIFVHDRIVPNVSVGGVSIGGMSRDDAARKIEDAVAKFEARGLTLSVEETTEPIRLESIGFDIQLASVIDQAYAIGHEGRWFMQFRQRLGSLWSAHALAMPVIFDEQLLEAQISDVADLVDIDRHDIRLEVVGTTISLKTDTSVGRILDQEKARLKVVEAMRWLISDPIALARHDDAPRADRARALQAVGDAQQMIARPIYLSYEDLQYVISRELLASWITSSYSDDQLEASLDVKGISAYVTTIATSLNIPPVPAQITTSDGRVTGFTPPKVGRAVHEGVLIELLEKVIRSRATAKPMSDLVSIPLKSTNVALTGLDAGSGIAELIGKATTPFTGSPRNRISNIKNGVKFLTGTIVPAGAEFSTLGTLGSIDNTSGYLPELVIKGDRTVAEFGGGLCQVSTTLFRSVMDAGLPVTSRRNHSYRVSYYEKDGTGKVIGPGLDATIYEPNLDFKFLNDTTTPVLIIGYVAGDKVTFELYGTKDGRAGHVDGPYTLTETSAGEPEYIDDPTLAVGVKKQVEFPHPGGSAIATYTITYKDGTTKSQVFNSWYRRWPAKFLVGTGGVISTVAPPASQ